MVHGFYLVQALLSKVIVKGLFSPSIMETKKKKKKEVKLPDQPIHFTDEQTETSDTESLPVNH